MKFWAVWRTNGDYFLAPKYETKEAAIEEAARLCEMENKRYYVMEVVCCADRRILNSDPTARTVLLTPKSMPNQQWDCEVLK